VVIPDGRFRTTYLVPSSRVKNPKKDWILDPCKMRPIDCPETSVSNYHYSLRNNPQERSPYLIEALHVFITSNLPTGNALPHPTLSHNTHYFTFVSHTVYGCRQNFSSPEDGSKKSTYKLGFKLKTLATPTNAQFYELSLLSITRGR